MVLFWGSFLATKTSTGQISLIRKRSREKALCYHAQKLESKAHIKSASCGWCRQGLWSYRAFYQWIGAQTAILSHTLRIFNCADFFWIAVFRTLTIGLVTELKICNVHYAQFKINEVIVYLDCWARQSREHETNQIHTNETKVYAI